VSHDENTECAGQDLTNVSLLNTLPGVVDEDDSAGCHLDPQAAVPNKFRLIGKKELEQIQQNISETTRPQWQSGPPCNLGTKGCGKLKADQWRSLIEFDIPVSLMKMWSEAIPNQGKHLDDTRYKVLNSTMLLATALRWGTSHRTSTKHAAEYMRNMRAYLASLRDLFPNTDLRTTHHNALFIGEMLLRFGPVHGWWMFPFERVIGLLQQVNTNSKMGKS